MRIISASLVLSLGTVTFLALAAPRLYTGYSETEVRRTLQEATEGQTLDGRVAEALEEGDVAAARQYAALADELNKPLSDDSRQALAAASGTIATVVRTTGDFAGAYVTGRADSAAGLAGAVVSDLTVVGDVRDIISEGGKAAVGEEYSEFLLALAAVGLAAEGATIATGGSSLMVKAGVSVLKVAKRTGNLTAAFSARLVRLARAAAGGPADAVEVASASSRAAISDAAVVGSGTAARLTRGAARTELAEAFTAVTTVARNAGSADTVKLLRTVRTTEDLRELATFSQRFGRRSRAVVELTGKTTLRAFRASVRGLRVLVAFLWSLLGWLAGLIALRFVKRLLSGALALVRGAFVAVALP